MIRNFKPRFVSHWIELKQNQQGAAALTVFLIILAVSLIVVSTTALIGVDNLSIGFSQQASSDMILSAESCVEEAMVRLRRDSSYAGGSLVVGDATCTIAVTGTPCGACTIDVEAQGDGYVRNIQASVFVSGGVVDLVSVKEIE